MNYLCNKNILIIGKLQMRKETDLIVIQGKRWDEGENGSLGGKGLVVGNNCRVH